MVIWADLILQWLSLKKINEVIKSLYNDTEYDVVGQ